MLKVLLIISLLNRGGIGDILISHDPYIGDEKKGYVIESKKRKRKGHKGRRRGGNGLR